MIQRIQSLYLLLTTMLSLLFLKGGILNFTDSNNSFIELDFSGLYRASDLLEKTWPAALVIILISLLSAFIIVLFKKRDLQLKLCKILISLIIGLIIGLAFYAYTLSLKYNAEIKPVFTMAVPVLQLVFALLAYRGIKKDDELVRSYDRLR